MELEGVPITQGEKPALENTVLTAGDPQMLAIRGQMEDPVVALVYIKTIRQQETEEVMERQEETQGATREEAAREEPQENLVNLVQIYILAEVVERLLPLMDMHTGVLGDQERYSLPKVVLLRVVRAVMTMALEVAEADMGGAAEEVSLLEALVIDMHLALKASSSSEMHVRKGVWL